MWVTHGDEGGHFLCLVVWERSSFFYGGEPFLWRSFGFFMLEDWEDRDLWSRMGSQWWFASTFLPPIEPVASLAPRFCWVAKSNFRSLLGPRTRSPRGVSSFGQVMWMMLVFLVRRVIDLCVYQGSFGSSMYNSRTWITSNEGAFHMGSNVAFNPTNVLMTYIWPGHNCQVGFHIGSRIGLQFRRWHFVVVKKF